jgi:UDP-N-acetylglucosamine 2-epimerase (non-hydrolysing)
MAPLVRRLKASPADVRVCVTGQHKEMLQQVLDIFEIEPDFDLQVMKQGQDLFDVTSRVLMGMREVLTTWTPDVVVVHGDTTTTFAATLAAFYMKVQVAHVEAGLRTGNLYDPWPEEANRALTGRLASLHFAPTATSRLNLVREGVPEGRIFVTGNTVIDALLYVVDRIERDSLLLNRSIEIIRAFGYRLSERKFVLITGHRRENFGQRFKNIFSAIKELAQRFTDIDFVYPVHLNPNVRVPAQQMLGGIENVYLLEPLEYEPFVYLMSKAHIIITDSGGIQEEAPSLGKPVLVMRDTTERPEAVDAGTVHLVGTDKERIMNGVISLLEIDTEYSRMSKAHNPYGDGHAADRIAQALLSGS